MFYFKLKVSKCELHILKFYSVTTITTTIAAIITASTIISWGIPSLRSTVGTLKVLMFITNFLLGLQRFLLEETSFWIFLFGLVYPVS